MNHAVVPDEATFQKESYQAYRYCLTQIFGVSLEATRCVVVGKLENLRGMVNNAQKESASFQKT